MKHDRKYDPNATATIFQTAWIDVLDHVPQTMGLAMLFVHRTEKGPMIECITNLDPKLREQVLSQALLKPKVRP